MADEQREPFYNKIFFCDVVGYSRLDPLRQYSCQRALNDGVMRALHRLSAALEEDVIALPTGDGLILNFLHPATDAHLRTALLVLEHLEETAAAEGSRFGLRVGLNSWTDTWVRDINGKRNVVGSGVNLAQRIMDIGQHGQIMMHGRVGDDLESHPAHASRIVRIGDFTVKHDVKVPVAQYVNPDLPYVSAECAQVPQAKPLHSFDLDDIMEDRVKAEVLRVHLDSRARSNLARVQTFIEEYFDAQGVFQDRKIWASWIAGEMIENAFAHNPPTASAGIELVIAKSRDGMLISILQPDAPRFDLPAVLRDPERSQSFMQLMHRRGVKWDIDRPDGRMRLCAELPDHIDPTATASLAFNLQATASDPLPDAVAALVDGRLSECVEDGVAFARAEFDFARVDELNYDQFSRWLMRHVEHSAESVRAVVFDLSAVGYISSRGLRAITLATRAAAARGFATGFVITSPVMIEIMHISRYDKILSIFGDVPSAWERFK